MTLLPTHHAECFGGVKVKPGEMLGMAGPTTSQITSALSVAARYAISTKKMVSMMDNRRPQGMCGRQLASQMS